VRLSHVALQVINYSNSFHSFPFDVNQSPYYQVTFATAAWSMLTSVCVFYGILVFFFGVSMHVAALFDILSARLETLVQREIDDAIPERFIRKLSDEQNQLITEKVKEIVQQHEVLIEFCELVSQTFTWIVACHFISSAIQICCGSLLLFLTDGVERIKFLITLLSLLAEAFIFNYAGAAIFNASSGLQVAAYNFQWYKCNAGNRRMILLIMARAQKKICIKAPFYFEASMESLLRVNKEMRSFLLSYLELYFM